MKAVVAVPTTSFPSPRAVTCHVVGRVTPWTVRSPRTDERLRRSGLDRHEQPLERHRHELGVRELRRLERASSQVIVAAALVALQRRELDRDLRAFLDTLPSGPITTRPVTFFVAPIASFGRSKPASCSRTR